MGHQQAKSAYYGDHVLPPSLVGDYFRWMGPADRVLDLACGNGGLGRYAPAGTAVFGVDIDVNAAREAAACCTVAICDAQAPHLPFLDAAFDCVVAKDIIEHVERPVPVVAEIRRVLCTGGRLVVSVPMAKARVVWNDYTHIRGFTARAIRTLLLDGGFEVSTVRKMGPVPLTSRFRMTRFVPALLALPPFDYLWGSSWEVLAIRRDDAPADG